MPAERPLPKRHNFMRTDCPPMSQAGNRKVGHGLKLKTLEKAFRVSESNATFHAHLHPRKNTCNSSIRQLDGANELYSTSPSSSDPKRPPGHSAEQIAK